MKLLINTLEGAQTRIRTTGTFIYSRKCQGDSISRKVNSTLKKEYLMVFKIKYRIEFFLCSNLTK